MIEIIDSNIVYLHFNYTLEHGQDLHCTQRLLNDEALQQYL